MVLPFFGADHKWGNFPALGAAWIVSDESFLKENNKINFLKLKVSYGKNGNQGIGSFETLSRVTNGQDGDIEYEFSNDPTKLLYGMYITTLGNSSLGWETTTSFNWGIESSWLNQRISLNADIYFAKTTDQLFTRQIPEMNGFSSVKESMGQVNNRGIELNLHTINVRNHDLTWSSQFTFWQNRNKLKKLYGDDLDGDGVEDDDISNNLFIGKSLGAIYGYEFDGIVQEEDIDYMNAVGAVPGDAKFKDLDGDGFITPENDRKILGYWKENFRMNFSNTLQYKNFEFYVLLSGIFGGGKNNYFLQPNQRAFLTASDKHGDNGLDHIWWTAENRSNTYPSITYNDNKFLGLQSRSFVRIQDITLSYKFNKTQLGPLNIRGLKIYSGIKNLYTFTNWIGGDPEKGTPAMSGNYPVVATYSLGVKVNF